MRWAIRYRTHPLYFLMMYTQTISSSTCPQIVSRRRLKAKFTQKNPFPHTSMHLYCILYIPIILNLLEDFQSKWSKVGRLLWVAVCKKSWQTPYYFPMSCKVKLNHNSLLNFKSLHMNKKVSDWPWRMYPTEPEIFKCTCSSCTQTP